MRVEYTVIFEPQTEGGYTAIVPALPGCVSEGETLEEAREMAADAIKCYCESLLRDGSLPPPDMACDPMSEKVSALLVGGLPSS